MAQIIKFTGVCNTAPNPKIEKIINGNLTLVETDGSTIIDSEKYRIKLADYRVFSVDKQKITLISSKGEKINIAIS